MFLYKSSSIVFSITVVISLAVHVGGGAVMQSFEARPAPKKKLEKVNIEIT